MDFRIACEKAIGNCDIKICIENCNGYTGFQKKGLNLLLESPVFGLTFDIGHNHACGGLDQSYIMENEDKLCHMHMHDAFSGKDHLSIGKGELNIHNYFKLAVLHNCRIVLETKTIDALRESVNFIRNAI